MKVGRNQPCPCGSGKKYKHCCANNAITLSGLKPRFIELLSRDHGTPVLDETFIDKNPYKELSAARLIYSAFVMPGIEELAHREAGKFINNRGADEAEQIKQASPEILIKMMEQGVDSINNILFEQHLLLYSEAVMPEIISKLRNNESDFFAETAIKVLRKSKINYSKQILEIIGQIQDPYTLSLVNLLLGFIGPRETIQTVWQHYHAFKAAYPLETFEQGPLFGLYRFQERFYSIIR
ncbi:hypothetical protein DCCM_2423 [Desulfocucumis palustris]|uniref:SEC-C motif domain protein n=1 Tax=Desulfocucumis palustris TaxID=1898651 RepID=A0A2L2XBG7_9FIRM|nr:SEC-C metal-binding domain-containing protein [Desulfocucumis palustris]GBF33324.1 hypothetical protein DCCM_2423 [Desulfocucumis palustris]